MHPSRYSTPLAPCGCMCIFTHTRTHATCLLSSVPRYESADALDIHFPTDDTFSLCVSVWYLTYILPNNTWTQQSHCVNQVRPFVTFRKALQFVFTGTIEMDRSMVPCLPAKGMLCKNTWLSRSACGKSAERCWAHVC